MTYYPTEWVLYNRMQYPCYGTGEDLCYELKIAEFSDQLCGNIISLREIRWSSVDLNNLNRFNLYCFIRQIKEYRPPKKKQPDPQHRESVRIEHWNSQGVIKLTVEDRAVYESSLGRYIKTRSAGRVYLTSDNPPYIKYVGGRKV